MSRQDRSAIETVTVSEDIPLPEEMYYQGKRESILMGTLGVAGALAAEGGREKTEVVIRRVMDESGIDVGGIVAERFSAELDASGVVGDVVAECDGCPRVDLTVKIYGFAQPQGLSSQLKPMLGVEGKLRASSGSVLWQKYAYVTNLNGETPSHTLDEYLEQPELMREAFSTAADLVVGDLIDHMRGY